MIDIISVNIFCFGSENIVIIGLEKYNDEYFMFFSEIILIL